MTILEGQIATKVSQQDFNELGERVSSAETQITQKADTVTVTALQTTVDEVSGRVTENAAWIEANADKVASQITREEFDELGGKVTSNTSLIEQTAEAIRSEVSSATEGLQTQITQQAGEIDLKASQSDVDTLTGRVTTAEATIETQANQIALRVTTTDFDTAMRDKLDANAPSVGVNTGSGITINTNGVYVEGKEIDLRTSDGDEYVHISDAGVSASSITAPNVAARYDGPDSLTVNPLYTSAEMEAAPGARFRSLKDALMALSGRYVPYSVNVTLAAGAVDYGDAALHGCVAPYGIGIYGQSASNRSAVNGKVAITQCVGTIYFTYIDVNSAANTDGIFIDGSGMVVHVGNCNFSGSGGSAVSTTNAANVQVYSTSMRGYTYAIYAFLMSTVYSNGNKGNCDIAADNSIVYGVGYQPSSTATLAPAEIRGGMFRDGGCAVDQGSGGAAIPTLTTVSYTATATGSYDSDSKITNMGDDVGQGWYNNTGRIRGCMWFDNTTIRNAMSGRTVLSATLQLAMRSNVGRGASVTVELSGTYSDSGASSAAVTMSYGVLGTASPGETVSFALPVAAVTDLINGTINGLMLYSSDTGAYKGRDYSKNYAKFDGAADSAPPVLTVIYQ